MFTQVRVSILVTMITITAIGRFVKAYIIGLVSGIKYTQKKSKKVEIK